MESNSIQNRILCSERSYHLLKEQAPSIKTKSGGKIKVKGKGDMYVYWVGSRKLLASARENQRKAVGFAMDEPSETGHSALDLLDDCEGFESANQSPQEINNMLE